LTDAERAFSEFRRKVESTPLQLQLQGGSGGGAGGASTLSGQVIGASAPQFTSAGLGIGAASPNLSFLGAQIAKQITEGITASLAQSSGLPIGSASPNWSYILRQQEQQSGPQMLPAFGAQHSSTGFFAGGARRVALAGFLAVQGLSQIARAFDEDRKVAGQLERGETDQAIETQIGQGESLQNGLTGLVRRAFNAYPDLGFGSGPGSRLDDSGNTAILRQAQREREGQKLTDSFRNRTFTEQFKASSLGLGAFDKVVAETDFTNQQTNREDASGRFKATQIGGAGGVLLNRQIDAYEASIKKLGDALVIEAGRIRGLELTSLGRGTERLDLLSRGRTREAGERDVSDSYQDRIDAERDPDLKKALVEQRDAALAAHQRQDTRRDFLGDLSQEQSISSLNLQSQGQTRAAARLDFVNRLPSVSRFWEEEDPARRTLLLNQTKRATEAFDRNQSREDFITSDAGSYSNLALSSQLARNPIAAIGYNAAAQRSELQRLDPADPRRAILGQQIDLQEQLGLQHRRDQANDSQRALSGAGRSLDLLLAHNPIGADVNDILTAGDQASINLQRAGLPDQARQSLANTKKQIALTKQQFTEGFHAVEIGQNFETRNPRGEQDLSEAFKAFNSGNDKIDAAIAQIGPGGQQSGDATNQQIIQAIQALGTLISNLIPE